jgi:hypothetical protein
MAFQEPCSQEAIELGGKRGVLIGPSIAAGGTGG